MPEIKHIRDVAASVELYQKQRDASIEAQNDAAELRLRAERRLGEVTKPNAMGVIIGY